MRCSNASAISLAVLVVFECKGKFIYFVLDRGDSILGGKDNENDPCLRSIWVTLGMTGQFLNQSIENANKSGPRWYIELMDTETGARSLLLLPARRFTNSVCPPTFLRTEKKDILSGSTKFRITPIFFVGEGACRKDRFPRPRYA